MDLRDVHTAYDDHYEIINHNKIDVQLATVLSKNLDGKPIWLMNVGPSGVGKTMLTDPLVHVKNSDNPITHRVGELTGNSIASGQGEQASLAPKVDGKIMYVPDFSTVTGMNPDAQRKLYAQFRNLYDGFARKDTGQYVDDEEYEITTTFIGNVTNQIYQKQLIHQQMGTRFIYYLINDYDEDAVEDSLFDNGDENAAEEIGEVITQFLKTRWPDEMIVDHEMRASIKHVARWTAKMRAGGTFDAYQGELKEMPQPEKPTRLIKQFAKMTRCLFALDDDYPRERVKDILYHIGESCADPLKVQIYRFIDGAPDGVATDDIIREMRLAENPVKKRVQEMWYVGVLERNELGDPSRPKVDCTWRVDDDWSGF